MHRCLGVFREVTNSPNRETDDALILKAVLERLSLLGVETLALTPEEFDSADLSRWDVILPMCEAYPRLKRLADRPRGAARERATLWVNPPRSVLNCYRAHMVATLASTSGVRFPRTELRSVKDGPGRLPPSRDGWWIKRGDVHNTCDHDVVHAASPGDAERVLRDFAEREITQYIVQTHIPGDVVKFYGVGPGHWFTWFYHDPVRAARHAFEVDDLAGQAARGAAALDLEVFGGDAIVSPGGVVTLIDLNSWPSFALVRGEAAVQISWHLQRRMQRKTAARAPTGRRTRRHP